MRNRPAILALLLTLLPSAAWSAEEEVRRMGLAPYLGLSNPSLKELNEGAFLSPYIGTAQLTDETANNASTTFIFNAPLQPLNPGPLAGLEFSWLFNEKFTLLFGFGNWNAASFTNGIIEVPIQGSLQIANLTRKSTISYVEYYLGLRYKLFERPKKLRFYVSGSLHQVFDLEYREDLTSVFLSGDVRTFRKTAITFGQATGLVLLEGTGGAEWFINDRTSLGLEGGYDVGLQRIELTNGLLDQDFLDTDNIFLQVPYGNDAQGHVQYRTATEDIKQLKLNFNGWKVMLKGTVYF